MPNKKLFNLKGGGLLVNFIFKLVIFIPAPIIYIINLVKFKTKNNNQSDNDNNKWKYLDDDENNKWILGSGILTIIISVLYLYFHISVNKEFFKNPIYNILSVVLIFAIFISGGIYINDYKKIKRWDEFEQYEEMFKYLYEKITTYTGKPINNYLDELVKEKDLNSDEKIYLEKLFTERKTPIKKNEINKINIAIEKMIEDILDNENTVLNNLFDTNNDNNINRLNDLKQDLKTELEKTYIEQVNTIRNNNNVVSEE